MKKEKISVVINTYNSQKHLEKVLDSVKDFDQIVVCDMKSQDDTRQIAEKYNCKVVDCPRYQYVEPAREFAIAQADNNWILVIDSDEVVPEKLKQYLYQVAQKGELSGLYIPFKNYFIDKFSTSAYPDFKLRFFKKEGAFWPETIHSTVKVSGKVGKIPREKRYLAAEHLANDSVEVILKKNNIYSSADAKDKKNKKIGWMKLLFSPMFWFVKYFFIKKGFLDGKRGFIFACLKAQYKFSSLAKIYEYQQNNKK